MSDNSSCQSIITELKSLYRDIGKYIVRTADGNAHYYSSDCNYIFEKLRRIIERYDSSHTTIISKEES